MNTTVHTDSLYERIKKFYYSLTFNDYDIPIILNLFNKYTRKNDDKYRILDVGCGYGKKMIALDSAGYEVLGVDVNHQLVEANQKQGMNCITVEEFNQSAEQFDAILMSHIIEHFEPSDLKEFLDTYLDRLKIGGYLVIATPLLTEYFYDDFDHIKPYSPLAIIMVFGKAVTQVQYYSRNKLALTDLKFRRRHYRFTFVKGKYIRNSTTKFYQVVEFISILLYWASFGLCGKKDGWVGIFKKIK